MAKENLLCLPAFPGSKVKSWLLIVTYESEGFYS